MSNDADILRLLRQTDGLEQGFRLLMKQYGEAVYWHVRRIVVGHDDAEDVLQETAINIFNNQHQFAGEPQQLRAWIYRIATNEAIQHLRRRTRFLRGIDSLSPVLLETLEAENHIDVGQAETALQRRLLTLPTQQRLVFYMRYFDDLSYDEIARITGKNVNTLKVNYHLAKEKIEKELKSLSL